MLSKVVTFWLVAACVALPALAAPLPSYDDPGIQRSREILQEHIDKPTPEWAKPDITPQQRAWAKQILEQTHLNLRNSDLIGIADKALPADLSLPSELAKAVAQAKRKQAKQTKQAQSGSDNDAGYTIRVFTTLGQGQAGRERFKAQLRALTAYANVEVLIQGLPPGTRYINDLLRTLTLAARAVKEKTGQTPPPIQLAPIAFKKASVSTAPTVIYHRDGKPVARITGSLEIGYLKAHVADGATGALGARGPVFELTEVNLMTVIRKRLAQFDWARAKRQAIKRYWANYTPPSLPAADEPRSLRIDPTFVVGRTIRTPNGEIIVRKGARINPLNKIPFTGQIIAFDGHAPEQVRLAARLARRARQNGLRPIMLTQGLPGDRPGFDALADLREQVGERIYLLKPNVINRFHIQALPATIKSIGQVFLLREWVPDQALTRLSRK